MRGHGTRKPYAAGRRDEDDSPRRTDSGCNIATALELFGGNDNVGMADVARAARLSPITVYARLPPERSLIDALVVHAISKVEQAIPRDGHAAYRAAQSAPWPGTPAS